MSIELLPRTRPPRTNIGLALSALIGREESLVCIAGLVEAGHRLVTLVGPPGIGKTRVALAVLERLGELYTKRGGAYFCDLTDARTESDVLSSMLSVVSGRAREHRSGEITPEQLARILDEAGPTLMVLDNFEHLTFAATTVRRICTRAPNSVVLVTSRERLCVEGEVVVELPPLSVPDEATPDAPSHATELFVTRAGEAGADVGDARHAIGQIVQRLEGIPLAIELFAARVRVLPPRDLATRLLREGEFFRAGRRDAGRHGTLESAIAGSWNLLSDNERDVLARCSMFSGGFSMDLATAVLGEDAVFVVSTLRDKSLVYTTPNGRLSLYLSIRAFARQKLRESGVDRVSAVKEGIASALARMARDFVESRNMPERMGIPPRFAELRDEKENLLAALGYVKTLPPSARRASARASLVAAIALLLLIPAEHAEAELTEALHCLGAECPPLERAALLLARQSVRNALGKSEECQSDLAEVRDSASLPNAVRTLARVYQGVQLRYQGRADAAWACHEEAARELAQTGLSRLSAMNDACMGRLMCDLGNPTRARELNGRAFTRSEAANDRWLEGLSLANLAQLEQELGAFDTAKDLLERALANLRAVGETHYEAVYAGVFGDLYFETSELDKARAWYARGATILTLFVSPRQTGTLHASAAALEAFANRFPAADAHLARARECAARLDRNPVVRLVTTLHETTVSLFREPGATRAAARSVLDSLARDPASAKVMRSSLDVRFAARMLERALTRESRPVSLLRVESSGRAYVTPDGLRVSLERRGSLWRILVALVEQRNDRPNEGLSTDAIAEAGWPGERMLPSAARTRVRVAVATLRKLGLREAILTRDDGYLFDSRVAIARH